MLTLFLHFVQTRTTHRSQDFSRRRKLPLAPLIVVLISLAASGRDQGVATKLDAFFTWARRSGLWPAGLWPAGHSPHRSALTKARAKLPWQALATLLRRSVTLAYEVFPPREEYQWRGLSVLRSMGPLPPCRPLRPSGRRSIPTAALRLPAGVITPNAWS